MTGTQDERPRPQRSGGRMSTGEALAGIGALALLASMFLPWFELGPGSRGFGQDVSGTAWQAFALIDVLLALVVVAVVLVIGTRAIGVSGRLPASPGVLLAAAGLLAVLLILFRLVEAPVDVAPEVGADVTRRAGVFVGLAAALAVTLGGFATRD